MYTKDRNSAETDEKVMNYTNWRIKRWRIRRVLLYFYPLHSRRALLLLRIHKFSIFKIHRHIY